MKNIKGKVSILFLASIVVFVFWNNYQDNKELDIAIAALTEKGVVVNVSNVEKVKYVTNNRRDPFDVENKIYYDFKYKIQYAEYFTGTVVERIVNDCVASFYIGCLSIPAKTPLKMLYVPGDRLMWAECNEQGTKQEKYYICSRYNSTGSVNFVPPFTFDVERFKKN